MFPIPIGGTSVVYLQASCLHWRNWIWVNARIWKRNRWNPLEWRRWVHFSFFIWWWIRIVLKLWEDLDVSSSSWGDVSGLFAGELPSLKKLDLSSCMKLETKSMESIGMKALGTLFHLVLQFDNDLFGFMLWEEFNIAYSSWENANALFLLANKLPSLEIKLRGVNSTVVNKWLVKVNDYVHDCKFCWVTPNSSL